MRTGRSDAWIPAVFRNPLQCPESRFFLAISENIGSQAIDFSESSNEIIGAGEAALHGDFINIHPAVDEKIFGMFQLVMQFDF